MSFLSHTNGKIYRETQQTPLLNYALCNRMGLLVWYKAKNNIHYNPIIKCWKHVPYISKIYKDPYIQ